MTTTRLVGNVTILVTVLIASGCGPDVELDYSNTYGITFGRGTSNAVEEVRLYVTVPMRRFDVHRRVSEMLVFQPTYRTTNSAEIARIIGYLGDFRDTVTQPVTGLTYHILMLESNAQRFMHFRVFGGSVITNDQLNVYARSGENYIYSSRQIGSWLREVTGSNSLRVQVPSGR